MKQFFTIWNKGYKTRFVVADDHVEALKLCEATGFIRRAHSFRKYEAGFDNPPQSLLELLNGEKSGVVEANENGEWAFV